MELRRPNPQTHRCVRPVVECAQCGVRIYAAAWSEYLDDRSVRHLWSCDSCGYQFETLVKFPAPPRSAA